MLVFFLFWFVSFLFNGDKILLLINSRLALQRPCEGALQEDFSKTGDFCQCLWGCVLDIIATVVLILLYFCFFPGFFFSEGWCDIT